jgi:hypothetical protein
MVSSRTATALAGLAASLLLSVVAWYYFDTLLLFLFLPFVPFLFRGSSSARAEPDREVRECPRCGFRTTNPEFAHCPRDGTPLR